jgi:NAD+ kinase
MSIDQSSYVEDTLRDDKEFDSKSLVALDPSYEKRLRWWDDDLCHRAPQIFDIVLSLGGDGTVLYASYLFQRIVPPVLAFALGSLGFLTKFDFESHKQSLERVFEDGFNVNLRLRFEGTIMRNNNRGQVVGKDLVDEIVGSKSGDITHAADLSYSILNDVVLDRGPNGTMITSILPQYKPMAFV